METINNRNEFDMEGQLQLFNESFNKIRGNICKSNGKNDGQFGERDLYCRRYGITWHEYTYIVFHQNFSCLQWRASPWICLDTWISVIKEKKHSFSLHQRDHHVSRHLFSVNGHLIPTYHFVAQSIMDIRSHVPLIRFTASGRISWSLLLFWSLFVFHIQYPQFWSMIQRRREEWVSIRKNAITWKAVDDEIKPRDVNDYSTFVTTLFSWVGFLLTLHEHLFSRQ